MPSSELRGRAPSFGSSEGVSGFVAVFWQHASIGDLQILH